jgi:hypothetical protein
MDQELIDIPSALVEARTDDANHTTAAAARTAVGNSWDPEVGRIPAAKPR